MPMSGQVMWRENRALVGVGRLWIGENGCPGYQPGFVESV
jgi:hypothetical protein